MKGIEHVCLFAYLRPWPAWRSGTCPRRRSSRADCGPAPAGHRWWPASVWSAGSAACAGSAGPPRCQWRAPAPPAKSPRGPRRSGSANSARRPGLPISEFAAKTSALAVVCQIPTAHPLLLGPRPTINDAQGQHGLQLLNYRRAE